MWGGAYLDSWLRGEGLIREGGLIALLRYPIYKNLVWLTCSIVGSETLAFTVWPNQGTRKKE